MRPTLALLLALAACGPATAGETAGTTTADGTTTAASTGSDPTAPPDPTTTTVGPEPTAPVTTTTSEGPFSTSDPTTITTSDATDTTDTTTGDPAFCWGWEGPDGPPFMDLHDKDGNLLTTGSPLPLECGGQGVFMFGLYPTFGGFTPTGDIMDVDIVVDVDGFNNNPEGHFYSAHPVGYWVSCQDVLGGVLGVLPVFPFDNLDDLTALDGKPAQLHITVPIGDEPLVVDLDVVLSVTPDDSWDFCGG